jgi:Ser/Thr protein kinase RdoA (MazF antagonist)
VLKISSSGEDPAVVDFQVQALLHIAARDPGIPVPRMVRGVDGEVVYWTSSEQGAHQVRMLTWLEGIRYQDGPPPSLEGLSWIGTFLARLCRALQGFSHRAQGHFMPWDITNGLLFRPQLRELLCAKVRVLGAPMLARLEQETFPALAGLRRQVIHQDGHGANLLRQSSASELVAGMIDFGDMIHAPLICDLAASLSDFIHHESGPAAVAAAMCRGFHSVIPLRPAETDLLLDLVIARHILILELFEFRRRNMQHPPAFVTDEQPAIIASLAGLTGLDRVTFNRALRETCT